MQKTFYDIGELTKEIEERLAHVEKVGIELSPSASILLDQVQVQLAIAQQLSVISGTLKDLLVLCKSQGQRD